MCENMQSIIEKEPKRDTSCSLSSTRVVVCIGQERSLKLLDSIFYTIIFPRPAIGNQIVYMFSPNRLEYVS